MTFCGEGVGVVTSETLWNYDKLSESNSPNCVWYSNGDPKPELSGVPADFRFNV